MRSTKFSSPIIWPILLSCLLLGTGCTTLWNRLFYDPDEISILDVNLFDQRSPSGVNSVSWRYDWIFRRERLLQISKEIQSSRPSLVLISEGLRKPGSHLDDDLAILTSGAFSNYKTLRIPLEDPALGDAEYYSGLIYRYGWAAPTSTVLHRNLQKEKRLSVVGYKVSPPNSRQSLLLVNVSTFGPDSLDPAAGDSHDPSEQFSALVRLIDQTIISLRSTSPSRCQPPLILSGTFPAREDLSRLNSLLERYNLLDAHPSLCLRRDCLPMGNMYGEVPSFQGRRRFIFYQSSLNLSRAGLSLAESFPASEYIKHRYSLPTISPTLHPSLFINIRMPRCSQAR